MLSALDPSRAKSGARTLRKRITDSHVRLAVTGLSQSGKTAFITSLVNQLTQGADASQLPLFTVAREKRLISARFEPQPHLDVPAFRYQHALDMLSSDSPQWPVPTTGISELRLRIDYLKAGSKSSGGAGRTLLLDIVDYPGEWLIDLPMLNMNFQQWCEKQWELLTKGIRKALAENWCQKVKMLDLQQPNEAFVAELSTEYATLLTNFRNELGLTMLQPGRMICPGEFAGAPVLAFFPVSPQMISDAEESPVLQILQQRYEYYKKRVVSEFYRRFFVKFDRQIVLADCLTSLNRGYAYFQETQQALAMIMENFRYGEQNWLRRLFKPRIDRVLFVASKADHVTPEQYSNLTSLLNELTLGGKQSGSEHGVRFQAFPMAAIRATRFGYSQRNGEEIPAIRGIEAKEGNMITLYPGEVPPHLPTSNYFDKVGFRFVNFLPQPRENRFKPLPHIAMDKALEFLIGDKFK